MVGSALGLMASSPAAHAAEAFDFALIGDYPYFPREYPGMPRLLEEIRQDEALRFLVHLGDFHNPRSTPCSEPLFQERFDQIASADLPFVLTPGDNDWADCEGDPQAHLAAVRRIFFADPGRANGPDGFAVTSQSEQPGYADYVENAVWETDGVVFATLHMMRPSPLPWLDPTAADKQRLIEVGEVWLDEVFALANERDARAVFLATQVDMWSIMGLPKFMAMVYPDLLAQPPAFDGLKARLAEQTRSFGRPVVLANGDSHYFRIDKPLTDERLEMIETFTRVEGFGSPHGHWVRVTVDPERPEVFSFRQELVAENIFTLVPPEARDESGADPGPGGITLLLDAYRWGTRGLIAIGVFTVGVWILRGFRRLRRRGAEA
jgi:hypothetical protein